jgi:hypothetical protein
MCAFTQKQEDTTTSKKIPIPNNQCIKHKSNRLIFVNNYHFEVHPSSTNNTSQNIGQKNKIYLG